MAKYIIAFGRAWVCTNQAYKEIQEILLSIYGPKSRAGNTPHKVDGKTTIKKSLKESD